VGYGKREAENRVGYLRNVARKAASRKVLKYSLKGGDDDQINALMNKNTAAPVLPENKATWSDRYFG